MSRRGRGIVGSKLMVELAVRTVHSNPSDSLGSRVSPPPEHNPPEASPFSSSPLTPKPSARWTH